MRNLDRTSERSICLLGKMGITRVRRGWTDTLAAAAAHVEMLAEHEELPDL
jgi:hypothetical protein